MMSFLRRQQRVITIAITVCCISTFVFFGSSKAFAPSRAALEVTVWQSKNLSLSAHELQARAHFLASEMVGSPQSAHTWCAWMNPGFVSEWILSSGLGAEMMASSPVMLKELEEAKAKESRWKGYKHPYLGHLNYDAVLAQFNPPLAASLKKWKSETQLKPEVKIELYKQAKRMPSEFFTTIIRYHESAASAQQKDPTLAERSMAVFGYETMDSWFGKEFMNSCVKLIALGAQEAQTLGYDISEDEIKRSIQSRMEEIWAKVSEKGLDISLPNFKSQMFRSFGMSEEQFTRFWKELVLFENFYHHEGSKTLADPLAAKEMTAFISETREVDLYEVPAAFRILTLDSLAKLQLYWHYTTGLALTDPAVPLHKRSVAEIANACPELIAKRVDLEWKQLKLDDFRLRMGPKKMIVRQTQDDIWAVISSQVTSKQVTDSKERMTLLSNLEKNSREKVDRETLKWLLKHKPEELVSGFEEVQSQKQSLVFALASAQQPMEGISNIQLLLKEMEKGATKAPYTQDENNYYLFSSLDVGKDELLDFTKAGELSILEALLSKKLKAHYETMKSRQAPALYKEGKLLEMSKVRSQVLMDLFQPLLVELQHQMASLTAQAPKSQIYKLNEANEVSSYRFVGLLQQTTWLESQEGEVVAWAPLKTSRQLRREDVYQSPLAQVFELLPGQWSAIEAVKPLLFQKVKLLQIMPASKEAGDIWNVVDSSQVNLDAVVSSQYLQKWALAHIKQWQPQASELSKENQ